MVVHHIVTVLLLTFSYNSGFFRIGCVIMLLHDLADIFLEVGIRPMLQVFLVDQIAILDFQTMESLNESRGVGKGVHGKGMEGKFHI